ncbi:hypothetical protein ABW19_dt0209434 [Dactylella cylindrospora]|nr:hypothetical protein ABW19_dt0209434 [Dactylella cylindrospora]
MDGIKTMAQKLKKEERADFVKHLRRYVEIYHPDSAFEVHTTNRYTLKTHEASIVARAPIQKGDVIKNLSGVMVTMTKEEEDEFNEASNRDFSIIQSSRKTGAQIFLGPARFVNHDCSPNTKFTSVTKSTVMFTALRDIQPGEEITVYYSDHYFGQDNEECLCQSCEGGIRGGWAKSVGYMPNITPTKRNVEDTKDDDDYAGRAKKRARKSLPTPALSTGDDNSSNADSPPAPNFVPVNVLVPTPVVTPAEVRDGTETPTPILDLVAQTSGFLDVPKNDHDSSASELFTETIDITIDTTNTSIEGSSSIVISTNDDGYESDLTVYSDTDMEILNEKYKFGPIVKVPQKPINPDPLSLPQVPEGIRYPGDHLAENAIIDPKIEIRCICQNFNCRITFIYKNEDTWRFANHIPRCCPRCERHSKIYGLVWPKTILKSDDPEPRIMNPDDVERSVNLAQYKKEQKLMEQYRVENMLKEVFKKNLRRENRKLERKRRKGKSRGTPAAEP